MKLMIIRWTLLVMLLAGGASVQASAQSIDSLDLKIGQMIMIGMANPEIDTAVLNAVRAGHAGAVIFFERNIPKTNSYAGLKKMIWTFQQAAPLPLFVCIDQEGGKVNRLKEKYGFPRSISAAAIGKSKSIDSARFYAQSTAATLAGLGFNVNFAPVVDLAIEPNNPAIVKPERSYSSNPDSVILFAKAVIDEHRKLNVLTVLKHFPGHGSTKDDTHLGMADVTNTWTEKELIPYKSLIDSGYVDAIMSAHIVNKKLDSAGNPGTLSPAILGGILRKRLGYRGVVFSDDMHMHAITKQYGTEESIRMAILAGIDILCFSNNIQGTDQSTANKVHAVIRHWVEAGSISRERINESYVRIMKLKSALNRATYLQYLEKENQRIEEQSRKQMEAAKGAQELSQRELQNARQEQDKKKAKKK